MAGAGALGELSYGMESPLDEWAQEELASLDFGHRARNRRAVLVLDAMVRRPMGTPCATFPRAALRKGTYRFLASRHCAHTGLIDAMGRATARRCQGLPFVLVAIDGSSAAHTDRDGTHGVGSIGSRRSGGLGIKMMAAVAMTLDGVELGLADLRLWARPMTPDPVPHGQRALENKESHHWTACQHAFERRLQDEGVEAKPWYLMDAEADALHVLLRSLEGTRFTVRMTHNRNLAASTLNRADRTELKVLDALADQPPDGTMWQHIPHPHKGPARTACLTVRWLSVSVRLREQNSGRKVGDVPLIVVWAREEQGVPEGQEPLEWMLWTSAPVRTFEDAVWVVRTYGRRFRIEGVFLGAKSGACAVERAQLKKFERLARWITFGLSVAVRRQSLLHRSREEPDLPADVAFSRDEIDGALLLYRLHRKNAEQPGETPTLGRMVTLIAELGGYVGRSSGGPPGLVNFSRGMDRVETAVCLLLAQRQRQTPPSSEGFG
jgi:hypothetical protein